MKSLRFLLVTVGALPAWAPLEHGGAEVAWPAEAWPLPLADGPLAWRTAATWWTEAADIALQPLTEAHALLPDGVVAVAEVASSSEWVALTGAASAVAFTLLTSEGDRLLDADVVLNTADFRFADAPEPRTWHRPTVLAHELGHAFGLGHTCDPCDALSPEDPRASALMRVRLEPGEALRPGDDDRVGIAAQVAWTGPVARPRPVITAEAGGWQVDAGGPHQLARLWSPEPGPVAIDAIPRVGAGPWHLELWSTSGQGVVVALEPAPVAAPTPMAGDGGCQQSPGALALLPLLSTRRKSRCVSRRS